MLNLNQWMGRFQMPLLNMDQIPPQLREPAIMTGYRPMCCSPLQCFASVFAATNETVNFWTHFIPTWYFLWKLVDLSGQLDFAGDPYTRAFFAYMLTCCAYPLTSCVAHALCSMSTRARDICYFADYGALSLYSFGGGVLYWTYCFPEDLYATRVGSCYVSVCGALAVACTYFSCASRLMNSRTLYKSLRVLAFALPYAWVNAPLLYRVSRALRHGSPLLPSIDYHIRQFVVSLLAGVAYASHFPERLCPGKFDIIGNSHHLLHVCGIAATVQQMNGALVDLHSRREFVSANRWVVSETWIWCTAATVLFADVCVVIYFARRVMKGPELGLKADWKLHFH